MSGPALLACLVLTAGLVLAGVALLVRSRRRSDATGELLHESTEDDVGHQLLIPPWKRNP